MEELKDSILISDIKKYKYNRTYPLFPDWNNEFEKIKLLKERNEKIKTILNKSNKYIKL